MTGEYKSEYQIFFVTALTVIPPKVGLWVGSRLFEAMQVVSSNRNIIEYSAECEYNKGSVQFMWQYHFWVVWPILACKSNLGF
jgi:hypothetical protein